MQIRITAKNYRCFEDVCPATIHVDRGFTALVGPNNSGKSSLLRMFYEFRKLFSEYLHPLILGGKEHAKPEGAFDQAEVLCDRNKRALTIELAISQVGVTESGEETLPELKRLVFQLDHGRSNRWSAYHEWSEKPDLSISGLVLRTKSNPLVGVRDMLEACRILSEILYVGSFRHALTGSNPDYFDLTIGSDFVNAWNNWKTGPLREQNYAIQAVIEDIRRIFGFRTLDISAAVGLNTLHVSVDGRAYKLKELGGGLAQYVVTLGNAAMRRSSYILIDEPELGLHPALQRDFLFSLASYATEGVIFSTHSIGLARSVAEKIYSIQKVDDRSVIREFSGTRNYAEFLGEMSFSAFRELGFRTLLLVEGSTDVKTVQQFLRKLGLDHKVMTVPLGGDALTRGGVEHELAEVQRLSENVVALVDSERSTVGGPPDVKRAEFEKLCRKLGFKVHLTKLRATENYFSKRMIHEIFGESKAPLEPYQRLSDSVNGWKKADNWRIAAVMTKTELLETDIGIFLASLE